MVNPENVIAEYGADSLRLYEMFMGPLEQMKPWSMKGVEGVYRFLGRVWRLVMEETQEGGWTLSPTLPRSNLVTDNCVWFTRRSRRSLRTSSASRSIPRFRK